MNASYRNGSDRHDEEDDPGNVLAKHVATGLASLIAVAVVAMGTAVIHNSVAVSELQAKCEHTREQLFELHDRVTEYPPPNDVTGCRSRLEALERYKEVDEHRMGKLERSVEDFRTVPAKRADPFTGTEGRELERRIKELEGQRP